jgi:hypothetical protein
VFFEKGLLPLTLHILLTGLTPQTSMGIFSITEKSKTEEISILEVGPKQAKSTAALKIACSLLGTSCSSKYKYIYARYYIKTIHRL